MRIARHLIPAFAALTVAGAMVGATAAHAQTGAYYVAVPAQQPTRASLVTRETPWSLRGNAYVAARAPERDATLCDAVARSTGALASFSVDGRAYDADALAKCNAHAKGGAGGATAAVAAR
jgi:hypothetical protein